MIPFTQRTPSRRPHRGAVIIAASFWALAIAARAMAQTPLDTSFTYQGRLTDGGTPANGSVDFEFRLFNDSAAVGPTLSRPGVTVASGIFTVTLDFGALFPGEKRSLEVRVRPAGGGAYTTLAPRHELTSSPHAIFALKSGEAATLAGLSPSSFFQINAVIPVSNGGTGAVDATGGRANLQAAKSGANADITSLSGLTTPLSVAQGGTGAATASAARTALGAQATVTGSCSVGSSIRAINADGTVACQSTDAMPGFTITTLDNSGSVGSLSSLAIGVDGLGLIAYYEAAPNGDLKVAHCLNLACSAATISTIDTAGVVGWYPSLVIGRDGLGLIAYIDSTNLTLKVAHCVDIACSSATATTIEAASTSQRLSAAIGTDGFAVISYYSGVSTSLKVAHCANVACTSAATVTVDDTADIGRFSSIAIGTDGLPLIAYEDVTNGDLKAAHCTSITCAAATFATIDTAGIVGWYSSLTIGDDGLGLIAFYAPTGFDLKAAHCSNLACSTAVVTAIDTANDVGGNASTTIGVDGMGLIAHHDVTNGSLRVTHCSNQTCTAATSVVVDDGTDLGASPSITIGIDGLPLIAYYDGTNTSLKVVHCSNGLCQPWVRRR